VTLPLVNTSTLGLEMLTVGAVGLGVSPQAIKLEMSATNNKIGLKLMFMKSPVRLPEI
jgi:hypothetical protein